MSRELELDHLERTVTGITQLARRTRDRQIFAFVRIGRALGIEVVRNIRYRRQALRQRLYIAPRYIVHR